MNKAKTLINQIKLSKKMCIINGNKIGVKYQEIKIKKC